jgi:hypothetical protein
MVNAEAGRSDKRRSGHKLKLEELVKAYNFYSDHKITIAEIIPTELKSYFDIPAGNEYFRTNHPVCEDELIDQAEEKI